MGGIDCVGNEAMTSSVCFGHRHFPVSRRGTAIALPRPGGRGRGFNAPSWTRRVGLAPIDRHSYVCSMDVRDGGLGDIQGNGRIAEPPAGHSRRCWAGAVGLARRGLPPEDFAVSAERAVVLLDTDPSVCTCTPANRGGRGKRRL